jgi:putative lumazine-binding protein
VADTPLPEAWLRIPRGWLLLPPAAAVRNMKAPKQLALERHDEILSVDVVRDLALLKLKLQIPPRYFTDMLSCLKVDGTWKIVQKVMTTEVCC